MQLKLTEYDKALIAGEYGPAARMAMSIMKRMAEVYQAENLMDITAAHIDSSLFMGDATLEYAEKLVKLGAKVKVPSTLNVSGVDKSGLKDWDVPSDWADKSYRQMVAYQNMGCITTWTCAPYQTQYRPEFGQQIAWGESNAIAFANSVIGARTERYPDLLDICAAITGRVPAVGLHLTENRAGNILYTLKNISAKLQENDAFYSVLGYYLGKNVIDKIPVIDGFSVKPTEDQLKALCAGGASAGAIAMFHIIGITPEAQTIEEAFQGKKPEESKEITMTEIKNAKNELTTTKNNKPDIIALGSPHFSIEEFKKLNPLIEKQKCHPDTIFVVSCSREVRDNADKKGYIQTLKNFGGKLTVDTCILTSPMIPKNIKTLMTNSAKFAYYSPGLLGTEVAFGQLKDCVISAIKGKIITDETIWEN